MATKRIVYFISDRTGITAEALGKSLLSQFDHIEFERHTLPFIDTPKRAEAARDWINRSIEESGQRPIVFSSILQPDLRATVAGANGLFIDYFDTFISQLEIELGEKPSGAVGKAHGMSQDYLSRINAVNFGLTHDDGLGTHLDQAALILIGVSRCGKTPTCLYLALTYGINAANYPLTQDDLDDLRLPAALANLRSKLFGLHIDAQRLHQIRQQRQPDSQYASLRQCQLELRQAEALYRKFGIASLATTAMSVEEIATTILHQMTLKPQRA